MTVSNWVHHHRFVATGLLLSTLWACSKATQSAPRVTTIPSQTVVGGSAFALDLSLWVTSPDGQAITYSVTSGGGAVVSDVYGQTFDTVGFKTVQVRATDTDDFTDFSFTVHVQTAEEAVIQAGTGLILLDRGTVNNATALPAGSQYSDQFVRVSSSQGLTDTFKAYLPKGPMVFERVTGSQTDLYVFDPSLLTTLQLGNDPGGFTDEKYEAKTSDNRIVFTSGLSTDPGLYIYDRVTDLTREISAVQNSHERNAVVDADDYVYFERGPTAQRDIYLYDPANNDLDPVSTDATNEIIRGVVVGGGVVFSRDHGAGDVDLWFYSPVVGLTQVAGDVSTTGFQANTLSFEGSSPNGKVIFTETVVSDGKTNIYYWDSASLTTTTVAANAGVDDDYHGVTPSNEIVYTHEVTGSDWDVHSKLIGGVDTDLSGTTDLDVFQVITNLDDIVMIRGGNDLRIWDDSLTTLVAADSGAVMTFVAALPGGNVAYTKAAVGLRRWDSAGSVATVSATGSFAGAMSSGNFAVAVPVSAQDDMHLWNETTDNLDLVSAHANDEAFVVSTTSAGAFVFSRVNAGGSYDLYVWDSVSGVRQVSSTILTHGLAGTYFLDNR